VAGRTGGPKTRCSGQWTEARYLGFIKSGLRQTSMRWAPIQEVKKEANIRRGIYRCAGCKEEIPSSLKVGRERKNNVHVDHIEPIINPATGWISWDDTISRMFCEKDNLQVLCTICHDEKTNKEKAIAKSRREQEKLNAK
jgi:5-methylcytosine-specific restriction endonuclease McrA